MNGLRRQLFSLLNLHIAGVALLVVLNLFLAGRLLLAWHGAHSVPPERLQETRSQMQTLQMQVAPLRGLTSKTQQARTEAASFYARRIPAAYSAIAAELGSLAVHEGVRLTRVQYTQTPAVEGLAEIRMDASLSGQYPQLMRFINGLERDKLFFVIRGLTLTGQQGGMVNLRLRVVTYLRAADAAGIPADAAATQPEAGSGAAASPVKVSEVR